MKLVKSVFSIKEMSRLVDVIDVCWRRENNLYQQHITEVGRYDFDRDRFGEGRYIYCEQPPIYDEDWTIEKKATEYVLIGSSDDFRSLESICGELTKNLNSIWRLMRECEWSVEDCPDNIKAISALHTEMLSKVNYANRYVVE